ncbi:unnamed protein product [Notodromas monacha]|uniref:Uncharacterized protein n=1 Tax=Notodromas monacha TaxID=399045 RepID=A0A7R9GC68_9CRUS|nr:unnamed protein product [Notodromas monacha]CAG0915667.1 unnamed protein product [Notodromas monacha]
MLPGAMKTWISSPEDRAKSHYVCAGYSLDTGRLFSNPCQLVTAFPELSGAIEDDSLWKKSLAIYESPSFSSIMDSLEYRGAKFENIALFNCFALNAAIQATTSSLCELRSLTVINDEAVEFREESQQLLKIQCPKLEEIRLITVIMSASVLRAFLTMRGIKKLAVRSAGLVNCTWPSVRPLLSRGRMTESLTYLDLREVCLHESDFEVIFQGSPLLEGFIWTSTSNSQIISVISVLPLTIETFGIQVLLSDDTLPEIGILLEERGQLNLRLTSILLAISDYQMTFDIARQIFGGTIAWPRLGTVVLGKTGGWADDDLLMFGAFPRNITKLVIKSFVPESIVNLLIRSLPNLQFFHADVKYPCRGTFASSLSENPRVAPNLQSIFITQRRLDPFLYTSLQNLILIRPALKVCFCPDSRDGRTLYLHHPATLDGAQVRFSMIEACEPGSNWRFSHDEAMIF